VGGFGHSNFMQITPNLQSGKHPVAVITGASSGLGRATAIEFAKRGTSVALASRQKTGLTEVADECRRLGVPALVIVTDMTDESAVEDLASQASKKFGHVDVWINNAVVGLYGDFEQILPSTFVKLSKRTSLATCMAHVLCCRFFVGKVTEFS
jgi:short-subunit dehydrogenase